MTIGVINASLMVTRGETPELGKAFSTDHLGPFIIGSILYGLIVLIGLILCIIPGIIAAFMLSFYGFYILDRDMSATDALTASFNMVKDNFGKVFLVILVAFVINFVGAILCGIGLLVTAPLCWIILAVRLPQAEQRARRAVSAHPQHRWPPHAAFCGIRQR